MTYLFSARGLAFRWVRRGDCRTIARWLNDPETHQFIGLGRNKWTADAVWEWMEVERALLAFRDDEPIGMCIPRGPVSRDAVIAGAIINIRWRGLGVGTKMIAAVADWLFKKTAAQRILWQCHRSNEASRASALRAGFEFLSSTETALLFAKGRAVPAPSMKRIRSASRP